MCGIFGLYRHRSPATRRQALQTLLKGLKSLEYRGCEPLHPALLYALHGATKEAGSAFQGRVCVTA